MSDPRLDAIRELIQEDVGGRGLRTDPGANLITATPHDFVAACRSIADVDPPAGPVAIVTGFYIPHARPPCGETDGPLGALFLARALVPLGIGVALATDGFCLRAVEVGLEACGLEEAVPLIRLPPAGGKVLRSAEDYYQRFLRQTGPLTHLIALERAGPSHTPESLRSQPGASDALLGQFLREVPAGHHGRHHTMRGHDISRHMAPAHHLFEAAGGPVVTIGIGDGGNEIGMGKVPWDVIRRNVPGGGPVACRVPCDHLVVCGVSNWGAYGLAAGVRLLRGAPPDPHLFDIERERELLRMMVERGPLVDGVTGKATVSVDGLPFERYAEPLRRIAEIR